MFYKRLYAYEKGEDGKPKIIPEQAEVVRSIYDQYLTGASLRMIKDRLEAEHIPNVAGEPEWTITAIRSILTNENTAVTSCSRKPTSATASAARSFAILASSPCIWYRITMTASWTAKPSTQCKRRWPGVTPEKVPPKRMPPQA